MTSNKGKLGLILMAFVVLALSSIACDDPVTPVAKATPVATPAAILGIVPGDGQVGEAVLEAHGAIQDTADDIMDAANATGEGIDIPTEHGTVVIDTFWDLALSIAKGE